MSDSTRTANESESNKFMAIVPWLGWVGFLLCIGVFIMAGCSTPKTMNEQAITYKDQLAKHSAKAVELSGDKEKQALETFTTFLKSIGSANYVRQEIANAYAEDSYLNDTLKSLYGREEIKQHFLGTADTMTTYSVEIDDTVKSGKGYYIRWTMKFSAPKLAGGKTIETIGMSHVLFDLEGKVLVHQDFWDSSSGIFEHITILGGGIRFVKGRF